MSQRHFFWLLHIAENDLDTISFLFLDLIHDPIVQSLFKEVQTSIVPTESLAEKPIEIPPEHKHSP
jgi:hypothetical protein